MPAAVEELKWKMQASAVSFLLLFLMAMLCSQQAEGHWNYTADLRGRDGRDGNTMHISCNGLPCPPYVERRALTCAICSK